MIAIDPKTTALVLIDLQLGILALPTEPRPSAHVLETCKALAERFRAAGAVVVLVNVAWAPDHADAPPGRVHRPASRPAGGLPSGWAELADGLAAPGDIQITKRQWGSFTGTELDLQLRRRGIDTLVIGGIATNFGVELTARHAWELGYHVIVVEDACATTAPAELHDLALAHVFPRIAQIAQSDGLEIG